jgi:hypothetical protein
MPYLLGIEVWQRKKKIFLNQGKDAVKIEKG